MNDFIVEYIGSNEIIVSNLELEIIIIKKFTNL